MATVEQSTGSVLSAVAQHEQALLAKLEDSRDQARQLIETARAESRHTLQTEEANLAQEIAKIRREAEVERTNAFHATVHTAEQRLVGVREEAQRRTPEVVEKVLALFIPGEVK